MLRFVATVKRKRFVVTWHEVWGTVVLAAISGLGRTGRVAASRSWPCDCPTTSSPPRRTRRNGCCDSLGPRASITVAPNGIDLDAVRTAYPDPAATDLVVVSRLMAHKRIGMLLDAVALLHAEGIPVTCRIIGDGPERDDLLTQARAQEAGLGG